jgi:hypothetical protein
MGVGFDVGMLGPLLWGVFFVGVVLILHALSLRGCLAQLLWFLVGVALVGVFWMSPHGLVRL